MEKEPQLESEIHNYSFYDIIKKEEEMRLSFNKELYDSKGKEENIRFIREYNKNIESYLKQDLKEKECKPIRFNASIELKSLLSNMIQVNFENELNIIQEIYKKFNFPMDVDHRNKELELISNNEELNKKFNCSKHPDKKGYFFCDKHRNEEIMCEECCESHIREVSNLGFDDKVNQVDYDKHVIYFVVPYIYNKILSGLTLYDKVYSKYNKIKKIADFSKNYKKLIDYNYYLLDKTIDEKFDELIQCIQEYRKKVKKNLEMNYSIFKEKKEFKIDWETLKKEISEDYYSVYHTVVGKLTKFKFKISELIKNSLEEIKLENLNYTKHNNFTDLDNNLKEDFKLKYPEMQPVFCSLKSDFNSIKNNIKEKFGLFFIDSNNIKYDPTEQMEKDLDYLKTKIKINFIADKCYKSNFTTILNNDNVQGKNFTPADPEVVTIFNPDGQIINNDFFKDMILPINSELIYIDDQFYNKRFNNKIIAIGGIYNKKDGTSYPNYLSILDITSKKLFQNIYSLKYINKDEVTNFERIGVKCNLVTSDELRPKRNLRDYYNLLVIGGNTIDGIPTQDLYLIKGIQFLLQKSPEEIIKIDREKRFFELDLINDKIPNIYSEVLKIDGKLYFLGGMSNRGEYLDEIHCYSISQEKFEKLSCNLPAKLHSFSVISDDINKNRFYIVGGLYSNFKENLSVYRFDIQQNEVKPHKLLDLKTKKINPKLLVREKHLFILGGHNSNIDWFLEVVNLNEGYSYSTNMLFNNLTERISKNKICLNNLGMITFIN